VGSVVGSVVGSAADGPIAGHHRPRHPAARRPTTTLTQIGNPGLTIVLIIGLITACSPPASSDRAVRDDALSVTPVGDGVYCDGTDRPAAIVAGAEPGETIEFTSPMPIDAADGVADEAGTHELRWRCDELESQLTWELTATGSESGRSTRFTITGSDRDPILDTILIVDETNDVVRCDDTTQTVALLSNAQPNEAVRFTSPDSAFLPRAMAGPDGGIEVRWTCSPDQDGLQWRLTATGDSSGRTAEITFTGQAPRPADPGDIGVEVVEDPFVCDRGRRPVARLSNLTPKTALEFVASPQAEPLQPAEAGSGGRATVFWQCNRQDEGTTWELTVTEQTPAGRSVTFSFGSTTLESPVTIEMTDDSVICDGTTRPFALLRNFVSGEAIDFESPQSEAIRQGRADAEGVLPLRWSCAADQIGTAWEITATGATSGASLTFTITGIAPIGSAPGSAP